MPAEAEELADDLERLAPTYVKLGQLLTRADLILPACATALSRLHRGQGAKPTCLGARSGS